MCNVYAMYSYETAKASDTAPFQSCWGDSYSQLSA